MRSIKGILPLLPAVLALYGCESASAGLELADKEFTDAQRAACPESPFKPEYPIAPKSGAAFRTVHVLLEIYTSRGMFVNSGETDYDPEASVSLPPQLIWNGKDTQGRNMPSGYYFLVVTMTDPASGANRTSVDCHFWVDSADEDKLKNP